VAPSPTVDLDTVTAIIRETAEAEILPRFRALAPGDVTRKAGGELVTVADVAAERRLAPRLAELLPGSVVVGEEGCEADPTLLRLISEDRAVWLVDPLDGTGNFAEGNPVFAVMVGLLIDGRCVAGWIHDPVANRTAMAADGQGATLDGGRLAVAAPAPLGRMSGVLNLGAFDPAKRQRIRDRRDRLGQVESQRCAGHEYIALASGRKHFALFNRLWPWDHAPGLLMPRQAGGFAARLDRGPYRTTEWSGGLLVAPDRASWEALYGFLMAA
jgi:fructose-1,6-bisphosphatase/inositol monophosphatase family enzyme